MIHIFHSCPLYQIRGGKKYVVYWFSLFPPFSPSAVPNCPMNLRSSKLKGYCETCHYTNHMHVWCLVAIAVSVLNLKKTTGTFFFGKE